jgi:hypothetical protein
MPTEEFVNEVYKALGKERKMKELKQGDKVWVSDYSIENAKAIEKERIYLFSHANLYYTVAYGDAREYRDGEVFTVTPWKFAVPVEEVPAVEMTMEEVNKALGKTIKIVEKK